MKLNEAQLRAVFWSGLVTGLLAAFPLTALANCFCCLWAWAAGAGAVHLARRRPEEGGVGPAALGAIAGAYAGLVSSLIEFLWAMAAGTFGRMDYEQVRSMLPEDLPQEGARMLERMLESGFAGPAGLLISAVLSMILFAIFGALGAVLYERLTGPGTRGGGGTPASQPQPPESRSGAPFPPPPGAGDAGEESPGGTP